MTLLIGGRYRELLAPGLDARHVDVLWLPDNPDIDPRLAGHADLSVFASGGQAVAARGIYPYIVNLLTNRGYTVLMASKEQGQVYPDDTGLCICDTGRYIIYNPDTADPSAVSICRGIPVAVAQGYTRCAALAVNDHTIITADAGVSRAAKNHNINVLDITPGYIELEGYPYGFIGGAAFQISDDTMAFTGTLDKHPDGGRIIGYLAQNGLKSVFLTDRPIFDVGGAVALP